MKLPSTKHYSGHQFALFRIVFTSYLLIHFIQLIPFATDIWSDQGMIPDPGLNLTYGIFPNLLNHIDSPLGATLFVVAMALCSLALLLGYRRQLFSVILWYGWACLFHRNNLIANPGIPMVGWLLLVMAVIPAGEPLIWRGKARDKPWEMPPILFWGAWAIVGVAYTISGLDKLQAPSWRDGTAMIHLLENPLARDWFWREWLSSLPIIALKLMTWATLALEIAFGVLCLFRKTRLLAWVLIMGLHIGILTVIDFADLTLGVVMIHLFTIDPDWFKPKDSERVQRIVVFDGVCGLCNHSIDFILAIDVEGRLKFTPLQGQFAAEYDALKAFAGTDSISYIENGKVYTRSTAVIRLLRAVGGPWALAYPLLLIPRTLRDFVYDLIAKHRYRFFGKHDVCRMPTPQERERFLD